MEQEQEESTLYEPGEAEEPEGQEIDEQIEAQTPEVPQVGPADGLTTAEVQERDQIIADGLKLKQFDQEMARKYGDLSAAQRKLAELEQTDKARAQALKADLKSELEARQRFVQELQAKAQQFDAKLMHRKQTAAYETGRSKLLQEVPELEDEKEAGAFAEHLLKRYSAEEIEACYDHRPLVAEYRAWKQGTPAPGKDSPKSIRVPRIRRKAQKQLSRIDEKHRVINMMYGGPWKKPPRPKRAPLPKDDRQVILYGN